MSARGPTRFSVLAEPSGTLVLRGELDRSSVPQLERKIARVMAPGRTLVLNVARLTFLASAGIRCIVNAWMDSGQRVVLQDAPNSIRRVLWLVDGMPEPEAWVFEWVGSGRSDLIRRRREQPQQIPGTSSP